jgi:hypothetical protein
MVFLDKKINRYLFPPLLILAIIICYLCFSDLFRESTNNPSFVLVAFLATSLPAIFLYFIFQFVSRKLIKNDLLSILICASFSFVIPGKMYRVMHWPGAIFQIYTGLVLAFLALVIFLAIKSISKKD